MRKKFFWIGAVVAVSATGFFLGWSNFFQVKEIIVSGSPNEAIRIIQDQINREKLVEIGEPIARVDPRVINRELTKSAWINKVQVSRNWISGEVHITFEMVKAIARVKDSTENEYLTINGSIAKFPEVVSFELPIISGGFRSANGSQVAKKFIVELNNLLPAQLQLQSLEIDHRDFINTLVKKDGNDLLIIWGSDGEISVKLKVLSRLLELPENKNVRIIDLANPLSVIVK